MEDPTVSRVSDDGRVRSSGEGSVVPGSIWREADARFTRFIKVISVGGGTSPRVEIQTVSADDGRAVTKRTTHAALAAFGRRYRFISAPPPRDPPDAGNAP